MLKKRNILEIIFIKGKRKEWKSSLVEGNLNIYNNKYILIIITLIVIFP
jgi:hypothetical protein